MSIPNLPLPAPGGAAGAPGAPGQPPMPLMPPHPQAPNQPPGNPQDLQNDPMAQLIMFLLQHIPGSDQAIMQKLQALLGNRGKQQGNAPPVGAPPGMPVGANRGPLPAPTPGNHPPMPSGAPGPFTQALLQRGR